MVSWGGKPTRISCGVWLAAVLLAAALLSGSEARLSRLDKSAASLQAATAALALAEDALKDSSARGSPALLERDETWAAGDDQTFDVNAVVPHDSTWTVISSGLRDHEEEGDALEEGDSADDAEEEWDNERTADGDMATDDEDEDGPLRQLSASQLHRVSALEDLGEMGQMRFAEPYSQLIVQLPPNNTQSSNSTNSSTPTNTTSNSTAPAAPQPINPGPVGPVGPVGSVGPIGPKGPTGATGNIDDVVKGKLRVLHGKIKVADQHLQRLQRLEEAVFPEWYQRPEACPDHWIRLAYYNNEERVHCRPPISEDQQPKNPNCNIVALFPRTFDRHEWCTRCKASWKKYGCHFNERGELIAPIKILPPSADSLEVNWPPKV